MADAPTDKRVRDRAHQMWLDEGKPEGRAEAHWALARELVAIEESQQDTLLPNPRDEYENNPTNEPIEPIQAVENVGEFPTLTDQGEEDAFPSRANVKEADEPPLSVRRKRR